MSDPYEPTRPIDTTLTTADLAGGSINRSPAAEARSFDDEDDARPTRPEQDAAPLFPSEEASAFRARWDTIQAGFVDEPRHAVEQADSLVAGAMKRLAETFAEERANLEGQWDRGDDVSTEDLRLALQRYRSFFGRLLSM